VCDSVTQGNVTGRRAIAILAPCQIADRGIQQVCPTALFVRPTATATEMFAAVSNDPPRNPQHFVKWIRNTSCYQRGAAADVSRCAAAAVSKACSSLFFRVERKLFMDSFALETGAVHSIETQLHAREALNLKRICLRLRPSGDPS